MVTKLSTDAQSTDAQSTLTDRYQTTVPDPIRKALGLRKRDKISYTISPDGKVYIARAENQEHDPVIGKFLEFLAKGIEQNPERLQPVTTEWASRLRSLVAEVEVGDINEPLSGDDD